MRISNPYFAKFVLFVTTSVALACMLPPEDFPPPSNLTKTASGENPQSITLSWQDNSSNETAFHVEKSNDGGLNWVPATSVAGNITSAVVLLQETDVFPYFRVQAEVQGAFSEYSNIISIAGTDPTTADTDGDGMVDAYEVSNGLDPWTDDAMDDLDGDRYPNIFEYIKGSDVADAQSIPQPDRIVNPGQTPGGSIHANLQDALDSVDEDYQIVWVKNGVYSGTGNVEIEFPASHPILLISESGAASAILDGEGSAQGLSIATGSVVDGFTIRNMQATSGAAVQISDGSSRFVNCVFLGNHATAKGGVGHLTGGSSLFVHSTLSRNTATQGGNAFYLEAGTLELDKSILWNPGLEDEMELIGSSEVFAQESIIRGGYTGSGNLDLDPLLTLSGHLQAGSPAIDSGEILLVSLCDMDGEERPAGNTTDIGADEWVDSDSNDLPDWWEMKYFGNLGAVANVDSDGDGVTNQQEYEQGSNPNDYYSQPDGVITPTVEIISGNNQTAFRNTFAGQTLVVRVTDEENDPLVNAPVLFNLAEGAGFLAQSKLGNPDLHESLLVRTDQDGFANIYYKHGINQQGTGSVEAVAGEELPLTFVVRLAMQLSAGGNHSGVLTPEGEVWLWGYNIYGQLGINNTLAQWYPQKVGGLPAMIGLSLGANHTLAVDEDGVVWSWGLNTSGQLGIGSTASPKLVPQETVLDEIVAVAAGNSHSLALSENGTVWSWGNEQ